MGVQTAADRVTSDPHILVGKPVMRGTRISVAWILEWLAGITGEELLRDYPDLRWEDVEAALRYGARLLDHERGSR